MTENRPQILIVDDEPININILVDVLGGEWRTLVATNGEQALRRCQNASPPDLILLDVMMPDMDGYEVCRRLKADPATVDIPVIFVTAMTDLSDETKGFGLGAVDYIVKPISPEIVRARVLAHIELAMARRTLYEQNLRLEEAIQRAEDMENLMRHDLKGPLGVIIGFPQLLLDGDDLDDAKRDALGKIENAGYRMLNMIDLSLDLAKMERGAYELTPVKIDVAQALDRVLSDLETLRRVKDIDVDISIDGVSSDPAPVFAYGEELLIQSVLSNLLKNAMEASPEQESVTIEMISGDPFLIRLRNSGAVPEGIRERFFEKYASSGKSHGTGLGTYSARMMVDAMDGSITLETAEQDMTSVVVTLPSQHADV